MTKQEIIEDQRKEICRLKEYAGDLRARHDKALDVLALASGGYGRKDNNGVFCTKKMCFEELATIAKMRLRTVPL